MNAMRIVVAGAGGRLGAAVKRHFERCGRDVVGLDRAGMDLRDPDEIRRVLGGTEFDVLVNCAALASVDYCERNEAEAAAVNGVAPGVMAEVCAGIGARMVQVGTDYVYDGVEEGLKREDSAVRPLGVYARTKLDGDTRVLAADAGFLVLRTAWVFGPDRESFIDSILNRALEMEQVSAVCDKVSSVCSTIEFASMLEALLEAEGAGGVVNVCQRGACSWQEYANCGLQAAREAGVRFRAAEISAIKLESMAAFEAARPRFTAMDTSRFTALTGMLPVAWEQAVASYVRDYWVVRLRGG